MRGPHPDHYLVELKRSVTDVPTQTNHSYAPGPVVKATCSCGWSADEGDVITAAGMHGILITR